MYTDSKIDMFLLCLEDSVYYAGLSDHHNYWKFGFPGLMINDTSYFRNPHYHEPTDTIETLNFQKMAEVVNSTYRGVIAL